MSFAELRALTTQAIETTREGQAVASNAGNEKINELIAAVEAAVEELSQEVSLAKEKYEDAAGAFAAISDNALIQDAIAKVNEAKQATEDVANVLDMLRDSIQGDANTSRNLFENSVRYAESAIESAESYVRNLPG